MTVIGMLSLPVPPSLSVAVTVATREPPGSGVGNVNAGAVPEAINGAVLGQRPGQGLGARDARVGDDGGQA